MCHPGVWCQKTRALIFKVRPGRSGVLQEHRWHQQQRGEQLGQVRRLRRLSPTTRAATGDAKRCQRPSRFSGKVESDTRFTVYMKDTGRVLRGEKLEPWLKSKNLTKIE